ncbi:hypothetical protein Tco_0454682 [Tanacetum coccineum]
MLLMQAQESGAVLDEEQLLFLTGEQVTNVDDDMDDSPENDLALNVDHVFEADECDAFDSNVDEETDVQHNYIVDSDADYTSDSNIILYDQYVEDNEEHVVQSNVSSVRNDALMSILDEMHEQGVQSRLANKPDMVVNDSVTSELARYKELVREYEKQAKFELTDRERKIDEQMRIIISDQNRKETSLKSELHSAQILLSSTVDHYKSKTEEVTLLKKHKVAIGYKNPVCLARAKQAQPALYNHTPPVIHDSEETQHFVGVQTALFKEVKVMEEIFDQMNNEVDMNTVDKQCAEIEKKNLLIENEHLMLIVVDSTSVMMNRSKLMNFVEKFIRVSQIRIDHLGSYHGLRRLMLLGDSVISRVYYVEGLGHNLFSVRQFCDSNLEVAFRKHTCFVRDGKCTDILRGSRGTNLYTISIDEMMKSSPICLLSKASKSKSWMASKGYRIYNKRTRRLMEMIHVTFDEMHQSMAPARMSSGPEPFIMNPGQLKTGLAPTDIELEMLFQPMFDEHFEQSRVNEPVPSATAINAQVVPPEEPIQEDPPIIHDVLHPSHNLVTGDPGSAQSSSGNVNSAEPIQVNYPPDHLRRWTKDHPLDNIVGNPSRPIKIHDLIDLKYGNLNLAQSMFMVITLNGSTKLRCTERGHPNIHANAATKKHDNNCQMDSNSFLNVTSRRSLCQTQPEGFKTRNNPTQLLSSEEKSSLWLKQHQGLDDTLHKVPV